MPLLEREDGVGIHWEERGEGPLVVLAPYAISSPLRLYDPVATELATDHRVVRYDDRGTGESTRQGPYDMDTGAADLMEVIEAAGKPAVIVGWETRATVPFAPAQSGPISSRRWWCRGDACRTGRAGGLRGDGVLRHGRERVPEHVRDGLPWRAALSGHRGEPTDDRGRDPRTRPRTGGLPAPGDGGGPTRAWVDDDALEPARACGDRLWMLCSETMGGGWFPAGKEAVDLSRRLFPEAHVEEVEDGLMSRPDLTAAVVRRIRSRPRAARA